MSGIYIHVPFCSSFCIYCDFYSVTECGKKDLYVDALAEEIVRRKDFIKGDPRTIYIGGGTPSLLSPEQLGRICSVLERSFQLSDVEEFTVEVNPDDITTEYGVALRSLGVNRVSMGVQSFDDENLKWMRRRHTSDQAKRAYRQLRDAGFDNISMDLIFGYKASAISDDEALERWTEDIRSMVELRPEHISAYQMSVEPGSMLALSGNYIEPSEEFCSRCYYTLLSILKENGYEHYEISNFSLPGYRSKHNSSYWDRVPYLGLGPAAHSFDGEARSWNPDDLGKYIAGAAKGWGDGYSETLSAEEALEEKVMLGLRKISGVSLTEGEYEKLRSNIEMLAARGSLKCDPVERRISIPEEHLFVSDTIISEVL